jgi:hypothetical protein
MWHLPREKRSQPSSKESATVASVSVAVVERRKEEGKRKRGVRG